MWSDAAGRDTLPDALAIPFCEVAERLGVPPMLSHAAFALYGYHRLDVTQPITVENLRSALSWTSTPDESWFFLLTTHIEAIGGQALPHLWHAQVSLHLFVLSRGVRYRLTCCCALLAESRDGTPEVPIGIQRRGEAT